MSSQEKVTRGAVGPRSSQVRIDCQVTSDGLMLSSLIIMKYDFYFGFQCQYQCENDFEFELKNAILPYNGLIHKTSVQLVFRPRPYCKNGATVVNKEFYYCVFL